MKDEEYELLPHREILRLREEVDRLKANPVSSEAANLVTTMSKLNESISRLIHIFEVAEKELAQEYKHSKLDEKLGRVVYQNKEIAKGIIAVADLIKKRQVQPAQASVPFVSPEPQQPMTPPSLEPEPVQEETPAIEIPEPVTAPSMDEARMEIPLSPAEHVDTVPPLPEKKKGWFSK